MLHNKPAFGLRSTCNATAFVLKALLFNVSACLNSAVVSFLFRSSCSSSGTLFAYENLSMLVWDDKLGVHSILFYVAHTCLPNSCFVSARRFLNVLQALKDNIKVAS